MDVRGSLATILTAGALLMGCDAGPTPSPAVTPGPTPRPTFDAPGSPSALTPEQIRAEIQPIMGQSGLSLGEGANGVISVGLRADAEELARELLAKYGSAVELTVGFFPYPPPEVPQRACAWIPQVAGMHAPLVATVALPQTIVGGQFFEGKLHITNAGPALYELSTSSTFSVYIFRPNEAIPVAGAEAGSMGTGFGKTLAPAATVALHAGGGTASCDLAIGYVLPAGVYQARALVDYQVPVTFELRYFWSEPSTIEVVDP